MIEYSNCNCPSLEQMQRRKLRFTLAISWVEVRRRKVMTHPAIV